MERLSQNLKLVRKERWRMSQDRFAQLLGSTRSKINSYENGGVEPSIAFILKLQQLTNLPVRDLFYGVLEMDKIPPFPLDLVKASSHQSNGEIKDSDIEFLKKMNDSIMESLKKLNQKVSGLENALRS